MVRSDRQFNFFVIINLKQSLDFTLDYHYDLNFQVKEMPKLYLLITNRKIDNLIHSITIYHNLMTNDKIPKEDPLFLHISKNFNIW